MVNGEADPAPRILVIEDDIAVARSLRDGLSMDGYDVVVCYSGGQGTKSMQKDQSKLLFVRDLTVDLIRATVTRAGAEISLTPTEYRLFIHMAKSPGQAFSPSQLSDAVWGATSEGAMIPRPYRFTSGACAKHWKRIPLTRA